MKCKLKEEVECNACGICEMPAPTNKMEQHRRIVAEWSKMVFPSDRERWYRQLCRWGGCGLGK